MLKLTDSIGKDSFNYALNLKFKIDHMTVVYGMNLIGITDYHSSFFCVLIWRLFREIVSRSDEHLLLG